MVGNSSLETIRNVPDVVIVQSELGLDGCVGVCKRKKKKQQKEAGVILVL